MRGRSTTNSSSIASSLRSISTGSPKTPIPTTPGSPGIAGFSTITINRQNGISPGASNDGSKGDASSEQTARGATADLNQEVAALSNKLIKAINHQTLLDDSLTATKHELELSKARIRQLEAVTKDHEQMMANGLLVDRKDMETEHEQFMKRITEEKSQRSKAERDKKTIEQELEHLTTALFEEANKMVSAARKERDMMDRKNEQLRAQLADTELLLESHQQQLSELKLVMQQMTAERDEQPDMSLSMPASPGLCNRSSKESLGKVVDSVSLSPSSSNQADEPIAPQHPISYSQLITPVLRYDIPAYQDFLTLLRSAKRPSPTAPNNHFPPAPNGGGSSMYRLSTGSMTSFQLIGMGMGMSSISNTPSHSPTTSSVSNGPSSPSTPNGAPVIPLKETRFYKRVMVDDIEPTLRLDIAPGLSWLAKRNTISAVSDGTLIIDPIPSASRVNMMVCSLCGESRNEDLLHVRAHRMRTSDTDTAQKYPLCGYCVNRIRVTCDFIAFLRLCKEALWKCDTEADEKHAWEVCTGHREKMFWSRVGGGVVPTSHIHHYHNYYQGSVFGGRNSLEYGLGSGIMSPRKVSGMSAMTSSTRGYDRRSSSMGSQQEEASVATPPPPPPPPKTPELPTLATANSMIKATPPPPVVPPKATESPSAAAANRKDPSLSPLRRIWTMGTNRVLGDRSNKALPVLSPPQGKGAATHTPEVISTGNKGNIPCPETPVSDTPVTPDAPQTPAFEREISAVRREREKLAALDGTDSPSSTRAMFGRERGDSVTSMTGTVIHRELEVEPAGRQEELNEHDVAMPSDHLNNLGKRLSDRYNTQAAVNKMHEQNQAEEAAKHKAENPSLPGGWD